MNLKVLKSFYNYLRLSQARFRCVIRFWRVTDPGNGFVLKSSHLRLGVEIIQSYENFLFQLAVKRQSNLRQEPFFRSNIMQIKFNLMQTEQVDLRLKSLAFAPFGSVPQAFDAFAIDL